MFHCHFIGKRVFETNMLFVNKNSNDKIIENLVSFIIKYKIDNECFVNKDKNNIKWIHLLAIVKKRRGLLNSLKEKKQGFGNVFKDVLLLGNIPSHVIQKGVVNFRGLVNHICASYDTDSFDVMNKIAIV